MKPPSPGLRRFLTAAVTAHGNALARAGHRMDPALQDEVGKLMAWLVLTPQEDLRPLEGTEDAAGSAASDGESGKRGRSTAVSRSEAAELLRVSVKSIDRLIASGALPKQKAGRRILIAREDLESYMREAS